VAYGEPGVGADGGDLTARGEDCWLRAGPFVLFGEPRLLAEIREALLDNGVR
jgi:hypothetical protein